MSSSTSIKSSGFHSQMPRRARRALSCAAFLAAMLLVPPSASARIIDRVAAIVDRQAITVSEVNQLVTMRLISRNEGESDDAYRRRILELMISQSLRHRDVERFGAEDIAPDVIEARLVQVQKRFASPEEFAAALASTELTLDEVRAIIKRRLQVEAYIEERFSPLIFVSLEEIERAYREVWIPQRQQRGLAVTPLADAREEIRSMLRAERLATEVTRWTEQLRNRANVDVYAWR